MATTKARHIIPTAAGFTATDGTHTGPVVAWNVDAQGNITPAVVSDGTTVVLDHTAQITAD